MSYDIQIWSVEPAALPSSLPEHDKWDRQARAWIRPERSWQIVIGESDGVFAEDIPDEIRPLLPGIRFLTEVNLEPIGAPETAHKLLTRAARSIAKQAHGVVFDPQADTIETLRGVKRYTARRREPRFALVELRWWFTHQDLFTPRGIESVVCCIEQWLPEAMPKRYGLYEPPQHVYETTGRRHFLDFFASNTGGLGFVWYPHRPVVGVNVFSNSGDSQHPHGLRCSYVNVSVEASALAHPGWQEGLHRFWRAASSLIQPFYGEVRTLAGFIPGGGTCYSDMETELNPTCGPWWKGVPQSIGHAAVLGEPYISLWPRFSELADRGAGLAFLSTDDWLRQEEASSLVGGVPKQIAQRWNPEWRLDPASGGYSVNWNTEYPDVWPF